MAWTEITRRHYRREGLRYESDTTDAEWLVMQPLPPPASALGRPRATDMRTVIDAILYIASTGCQWRQLPKDFPPYSTVQGYFYAWSRGGIFSSLNYTLVMAAREAIGREASPTAGVIDSQSVKTTESGGPRGFDAGKKIKGRKRHIVTDTQGNLVGLVVHEANIQDRDGAPCVLAGMTAAATIQVGQFGRPTLSKDGRTITVHIPITLRHQGGRKQIVTPAGAAPWIPAPPRIDHTLVKAIVRAFRWRDMLESGDYATVRDLARAEAINESYLGRILRFTLLAPNIIEEIMEGKQPATLELDDLLQQFPIEWDKQLQTLTDD